MEEFKLHRKQRAREERNKEKGLCVCVCVCARACVCWEWGARGERGWGMQVGMQLKEAETFQRRCHRRETEFGNDFLPKTEQSGVMGQFQRKFLEGLISIHKHIPQSFIDCSLGVKNCVRHGASPEKKS